MSKSNIPRSPKIYLSLIVLFAILLAFMPRSGKFKYDYKKGSPWAYETLLAAFDFPILKTEEQIQTERENSGKTEIPYYKYSEALSQENMRAAEVFDFGEYSYIKPAVVKSLADIFSRGIIDENSSGKKLVYNALIFVQKEKRAVKSPVSDIYTLSTAQAKLLSDAVKIYPGLSIDSLFNAREVYSLVKPNMVYDKESTELVNEQSFDFISPTLGFVNAGRVIVSKGEMVTAEIQQMLDSYKAEYENNMGYSGPRIKLWIGNGILALVLVFILFLSIFYTNPVIFNDLNRFVYLITIFTIAAFAAMTIGKFRPDLLYMTPFSLSALYLLAFFKKRVVLPVYLISLLPLLVFANDGIELFVCFLTAGIVTIYVFQFFNRGWRQFVTAMIVFVSLVVTYTGFRLINDTKSVFDLSHILLLFLGSLLSVFGYPLIYLFEKIFRLVSNSRLQELCDTNNNKLLTELAQKAPGTFQHSLQVMNLCEAAAKSIDANVLLVKAGALYHDIGKMLNPQCFIENDTLGTKYHEGLSSKESARDIIRHVADGMALAEKHGLPGVVKDFIITHHGTSCTAFFYNKYINEGGNPEDKEDFYYKGEKPKTKEQTILMLCDTLEAASRTLKNNKQETYDAFVEKMLRSKIEAGQLSVSDISMKEIDTIKSVLKSYLAQMYHARVVYPERKK